MKNIIKRKASLIKEISDLSTSSISTTLLDYKKVTSLEIKLLRKALLDKDIKAKILKNTLTKKALTNTNNKNLIPYITGQTLMVFSKTDISKPVKIIKEFTSKNDNLKIKAICTYGKIFKDEGIQQIINLKTKEQEISNIVRNIKIPIFNLITVLKIITLTKKGEHNDN